MKPETDSGIINVNGAQIPGLIIQAMKVILVLSLLAFSGSLVMAAPPPPPPPPPGVIVVPPSPKPYRRGLHAPPAGKVWVEIEGRWTLVEAPPENGPYIWDNGRWIPDTSPVPNDAEWVPGHWTPRGWIPGHWKAMHAAPFPGVSWIPGHWEGNRWVRGHWEGSTPPGRRWEQGHYGPRGRWIPGRWR